MKGWGAGLAASIGACAGGRHQGHAGAYAGAQRRAGGSCKGLGFRAYIKHWRYAGGRRQGRAGAHAGAQRRAGGGCNGIGFRAYVKHWPYAGGRRQGHAGAHAGAQRRAGGHHGGLRAAGRGGVARVRDGAPPPPLSRAQPRFREVPYLRSEGQGLLLRGFQVMHRRSFSKCGLAKSGLCAQHTQRFVTRGIYTRVAVKCQIYI